MQTATSETESESLVLSIYVRHYILRAPCPKGQGIRFRVAMFCHGLSSPLTDDGHIYANRQPRHPLPPPPPPSTAAPSHPPTTHRHISATTRRPLPLPASAPATAAFHHAHISTNRQHCRRSPPSQPPPPTTHRHASTNRQHPTPTTSV